MEETLTNMSFSEAANYIAANSNLTQDQSAAVLGGFFGALAGAAVVISIVGIIITILQIIAWWRLFTKAGEKGWKSIIPIYNVYVFMRIIGMSFWKWFVGCLVVSILSGIASGANIQWLALIAGLVYLVGVFAFAIISAKNTAKAYGKGTGFAVGLFFLPNIFELILGFGSAEYKGVPSKE